MTGAAPVVHSLMRVYVRWPASGATTEVEAPAGNEVLQIVEAAE